MPLEFLEAFEMRDFWLVLFLLLTPVAYAASCSQEDVSITTVEGIGTVYSGSDSSDELEVRFIDACFERSGWILRAPLLIVREDAAGAVVSAENATIESIGANGKVRRLNARGETTNLEGLTLRLESTYKIDGFASSRYDVIAERGQLIGRRLTLQNTVFGKLADSGAISERYQAVNAILEDNRVTLNQLIFGSPQFGLSAQLGSSNASGVQLSGVTGLVGRNSAGSEIGFSASSALRLENGLYRLENTTLNLFGLPLFVGRMDYDPRCPFEVPFVFGIAQGLTFGLENLLLTCDGKTRGTFAVYDLFGKASTAPFNSVMALGLSVTYTDSTSSYFVGQPRAASFKATVQHEPLTGLTSAFALDTGARIESPFVSLRSAEGRIGMAYNIDLPEIQPFTIRPKLELGTVGESLGMVTRDFHGFVRGNLGLNLAYSIEGITFSGSWLGRLTYYFGDAWNGFNVDYIGSLSLGYALPNYGSIGLTFANTEQPFIPPFATHTLSPITTISASLRIAPTLEPVVLGFVGESFENPTLSFTLLYNLRSSLWVNQRADVGFTVSFYDGSTPTDHLGRLFQTPLVSFSPRANYDLITSKGSAGANLTYFGLSLAYTLGFDIEIPTGTFKLNFGLRLR
jgi:hypothetical protein